MSQIPSAIRDYLDAEGVEYEVVEHKGDHTALQTAWDTHTPAHVFAKTVFVQLDGRNVMAVIPASAHISASRLGQSTGAKQVRLLDEVEIEQLCSDCELGAAPPFGSLYALSVYISPALLKEDHVTFNGGTHRVAIRMRVADFERVVHPEAVALTECDAAP